MSAEPSEPYRPAGTTEVERYLQETGFARDRSEPSWWTRDNIRVVVPRPDNGYLITINIFDRLTGDGWIGRLDGAPLRVLAMLLENEPRPVPAREVRA